MLLFKQSLNLRKVTADLLHSQVRKRQIGWKTYSIGKKETDGDTLGAARQNRQLKLSEGQRQRDFLFLLYLTQTALLHPAAILLIHKTSLWRWWNALSYRLPSPETCYKVLWGQGRPALPVLITLLGQTRQEIYTSKLLIWHFSNKYQVQLEVVIKIRC